MRSRIESSRKKPVFQTLAILRRLGHRGRERGLREQGRWCHIETETHPSPSLADRAVIIPHVSSGPDSHLETLYMSHTQYLPPNKNSTRLTDRTRSLKTKRNIVTRKLLKDAGVRGKQPMLISPRETKKNGENRRETTLW